MQQWTDIEGHFSDADAGIYRAWARECPDGAVFVELGTAYGRSAACLLSELDGAGKHRCVLYCVDYFPGHTLPVAVANLRHWRTQVRFVQCDVERAANLFGTDDGCTVHENVPWAVYVDASHSWLGMLMTCNAWLAVLPPYGRLGGHDYSERWPGVVDRVDAWPEGAVRHWGASWEYQPDKTAEQTG